MRCTAESFVEVIIATQGCVASLVLLECGRNCNDVRRQRILRCAAGSFAEVIIATQGCVASLVLPECGVEPPWSCRNGRLFIVAN